jgi:hypothetical protein
MKYRKKPVVVEAEQFWPDVKPWPEGVETNWRVEEGFYVNTINGQVHIEPGEWIITDAAGHYPCKPDIFHMTYEEE